jgi:hypothetical protein
VQNPLAASPTCDRIQTEGRLENTLGRCLLLSAPNLQMAFIAQFPDLARWQTPLVPQMKTLPETRIPIDDLLFFHKLTRSLTSSFDLDTILRTILEQMERTSSKPSSGRC